MKRIILFSSCFLLAFLVSMVAHAPASFVLGLFSHPNLNLKMPSGTLLQGEAGSIHWQGKNYGQIHWDLQALKLLKGQLSYHVRFGRNSDIELEGKGNASIGLGGFFAENVLLSVPAEHVLPLINPLMPISVKGTMELSLNTYQYASPWCDSAKGSLAWSDSQIISPIGDLALDTVIVDFQCEENKITASGNHNSKQIAGAMELELNPSKHYKVNAWFKPNAEFPASMKSQLRWLGSPNNKGEYSFLNEGKFN